MNLASSMEQHLPRELLTLLRVMGDIAQSQGQTLYLVGGTVRDLLLGRANLDVDVVAEGDALELSRLIAQKEGGQLIVHPRFGTAKFRHGDFTLDIVTARAETYARPGALPAVHASSLSDDLFRRDFTINAMALSLDPLGFGELVDPYGGKDDLEKRLLRILHPRSFIDDATRILRALRYEQRLDFHLEPVTESLLCRDRAMLRTISGDRLRQELLLILKEERPEKILRRAEELNVLREIHPSLRGNGELKGKFVRAQQQAQSSPALSLSLLVYHLSQEEGEGFIKGLKLPGKIAEVIRDTLRLKENLDVLSQPQLLASALYRLLQGYSHQAIRAATIACGDEIVRQRLELYLQQWRYVHPCLTGKDLQTMGLVPGPQIGEVLQALQDARLDGKVVTREEEEDLVQQWLKECQK